MENHKNKVVIQRKPFVRSFSTNRYRKGGPPHNSRHTLGREASETKERELLLDVQNCSEFIQWP